MHRLFLDANILFSAAYKADSRLRRLWSLDNVTLCTSRYALEEARTNLTNEAQWQRLSDLSQALVFFEEADREFPHGINLPDKDRPILMAAIEAHAHYLLTGDSQHFGIYFGKKIAGLVIATPAQYFKIREIEKDT